MNLKSTAMFSFLLLTALSCSQPKAPATAEVNAPDVTDIVLPADVEYQQADSLEVVSLLSDTRLCTNLDYARHFLGRPYVAYTLDGYYQDRATSPAGGDSEHLVVNLREFDCLTILETCNALAMTRSELDAATQPIDPWVHYCCNLERLRYFGGHEDGYTSRIHYLSMSVADHLERGTMEEVVLPESITKPRTTTVNFMSQHPQYYYALKNNPELVGPVAETERRYSGQKMRFLPQENCGLPRKASKAGAADLSAIHDGDLLYIVTTKAGLDYSHQGFAFWGKDGRLHLLHASSVKKRVMEDSLPLDAYLKGISTNIGVRVMRLKLHSDNL